MKKLVYSLFIILTMMVSCQDDVLNKKPLDIISDAVVWNDPVYIDAYLTGIYTDIFVFAKDANTASDANEWTGIMRIDRVSDECADFMGWGAAYTKKYGNLQINGGLFEWWENAYEIIRRLNIFIKQLPDSPVDDGFKTSRIAEARFLRAYNYFAMAVRYGGVPLITEPQNLNDSEEELYRTRDTEKALYDFIISEMDDIFNDLPETRTSDYGRPSKYAAAALKCRAALYAGSIAQFGTQKLDGLLGIPPSEAQNYYQKAYDAAKIIMNSGVHNLYNKYPDDKVWNFRQTFLEDGNPEIIFCRQFNEIASYPSKGNGWSLDFFQGPLPNAWGGGNLTQPYLEMIEEFEEMNGIPGTPGYLDRAEIQQGLWSGEDLFGNKEPRFFASIYYPDMIWKGKKLTWYRGIIKPDGTIQETGSYDGILTYGNQTFNGTNIGTGFGVLKYLDEDHNVLGERATTATDWKLFRYGEVLLNFAEAAFELNKPDEALDALNQIRNRAGVAPLTTIDRMKIRHERKIELAFEGHRYWDLRRWRTAVTDLTRDFSGLRMYLDYETRKYKILVVDKIDGVNKPVTFYEKNYYLPITLKRTGNNPNLVENPGYE